MKRIILLVITVSSFAFSAFSQSEKFTAAMKKNLAQFDSAKTADDYVKIANNFERIGDAEKTQWTPYYYAGLALSTAGWTFKTFGGDDNSTKIIALMVKAEAVATDDTAKSEIYTVRNMAY